MGLVRTEGYLEENSRGSSAKGRGLIGAMRLLILPMVLIGVFTLPNPVRAKPAAKFPPNPLDLPISQDPQPDPLLRNNPTPANLSAALEELAQLGARQFAQNDRPAAFATWMRELRLRRTLGFAQEVPALGRVGAVAWQSNQSQELRWISQRLNQIAAESGVQPVAAQQKPQSPAPVSSGPVSPAPGSPALKPAPLDLLRIAYGQVRSLPGLIATAEAQLQQAQGKRDPVATELALQTLAQIHLDWFQYPAATARYEQLLAIAIATDPGRPPQIPRPKPASLSAAPPKPVGSPGLGSPSLGLPGLRSPSLGSPSLAGPPTAESLNPASASPLDRQVFYLTQLVYIHTQLKQFQAALELQQKLIPLVIAQGFPDQAVALRLKIGDNYRQLKQLQPTEQSYQTAYTEAQPLFLINYQAVALRKLADLYRDSDKRDAALRTYTALIQAEAQSYNRQGVMEAYEQLGNLYLLGGQQAQAKEAYQWALNMAQQLNYRVEFFQKRIAEVSLPR